MDVKSCPQCHRKLRLMDTSCYSCERIRRDLSQPTFGLGFNGEMRKRKEQFETYAEQWHRDFEEAHTFWLANVGPSFY